MTTLDAILEDARADPPRRFTLYRVAAECAEDGGADELAAGLRWLADSGREPALLSTGRWQWYSLQGDALDCGPYYCWRRPRHHLPTLVGRCLYATALDDTTDPSAFAYATFPEAVLAAARAAAKKAAIVWPEE